MRRREHGHGHGREHVRCNSISARGKLTPAACAGALALAAVMAISGCAQKNAGEDQQKTEPARANEPDHGGPPSAGTDEATYSTIRQKIFEPKCASCHFAGGEAQFLRLDSLSELKMYPGLVVADPSQSILIQRVTRDDELRMPPPASSLPRLNDEEISLLRSWVSLGAPE